MPRVRDLENRVNFLEQEARQRQREMDMQMFAQAPKTFIAGRAMGTAVSGMGDVIGGIRSGDKLQAGLGFAKLAGGLAVTAAVASIGMVEYMGNSIMSTGERALEAVI